jgi:hypothetical protein
MLAFMSTVIAATPVITVCTRSILFLLTNILPVLMAVLTEPFQQTFKAEQVVMAMPQVCENLRRKNGS